MKRLLCLFTVVVLLMGSPVVSALDVVTTTSVLWDPVSQIGGDAVNAIYIADPTVCPHLQGDILPGLLQKNADALKSPDLFLAHNSSMDAATMAAIAKFRDSNGYGKTNWKILKTDTEWNTPQSAEALADTILGWLKAADPKNAEAFTANAEKYKAEIADAGNLTADEKALLSKKHVIVMAWQKEPVQKWLGVQVYDFFAPEFAYGGNKTPAKVVDAIQKDKDKIFALDLVSGGGKMYVIENMQSGEMAKGIEESLTDIAVKADRVTFTNFPKSVDGVNSIPDVLTYNKNLLLA
ncbi:MAG: metal ABC transporter substrate-binding protein [Methanomicrobiales archaeon HGW-Methanomicrobiales-4]|nr:MAG: metal ABC transporter substrate-binding protein [Methanomicrobiales archaeon HGW-Methanomicrobiales-4]